MSELLLNLLGNYSWCSGSSRIVLEGKTRNFFNYFMLLVLIIDAGAIRS